MTAPTIDRPGTIERPRPQTCPRENVGGEDMSSFENQFEKMCEAKKPNGTLHPTEPCGKSAKWIAQVAHSDSGCPSMEIFLCDDHAKVLLKMWQNFLKVKPPMQCPHCNAVLSGQLSDFVKAIRL